MPAAAIALAVPPLLTRRHPRSDSAVASSTIPVLSYTDSNAEGDADAMRSASHSGAWWRVYRARRRGGRSPTDPRRQRHNGSQQVQNERLAQDRRCARVLDLRVLRMDQLRD